MKELGKSCVLLLSALVVLWPGAVVGAEQPRDIGVMSGSTEILLSGVEWKLGSFPMGAGEEHKAFESAFDDSSFRSVPVPAEIQLTLGLEGMGLYRQSKELSLINKQEWWYRKRFTLPQGSGGQKGMAGIRGVGLLHHGLAQRREAGRSRGRLYGFRFRYHVSYQARNGKPFGSEGDLSVAAQRPQLVRIHERKFRADLAGRDKLFC